MNRILILAALAVATLAGRAIAGPMASENYQITASVVASGGGSASSANYQMVATIGEPVVGPAASAAYDLYAGFLAALLAVSPRAGDVNGDGIVDAVDVRMLLRIAGGMTNADTSQSANGDVTGNGRIEASDAVKVLRYMNGLQPTLP